MPLHKFDDRDFDRFVREKFESAPQPSFDSKAWDTFASKQRSPYFNYWITRGAYIAFVIIALISTTQFSGHNEQFRDVLEDRLSTSDINSSVTSSIVDDTSDYQNRTNTITAADNTKRINTVDGSDVIAEGDINENDKSPEVNENQVTHRNIGEEARNYQKDNSNSVISSIFKDKSNQESYNNNLGNTFSINENDQIDRQELIRILPREGYIVDIETPSIEIEPTAVVYDEPAEETVIDKKKITGNRLVLSALVNADLSTIRFDDFANPGVGFGVRATYKIGNRLSIGAGVTKTERIYNVSDQQDYSLPLWLINRQGVIDGVAVKCNITEIPITLRYDLISTPNTNLYGQISSSTFFMDREFYDFDFALGQAGPNSINDVTINNQNTHFLGVVGLTLGYEKYFTKRIGLGFEVYYQTTIQGIGVYQINLNSVGNQILLNYRIF